jgi:hypothetical protein
MRLRTCVAERGLKARALFTLGMTLAAVAAMAIGQAAPALADPSMTLVAVGSAETQDVFNQFAVDLAGNGLASYDATTPLSGASNETLSPVDGSSGTPPLGTRCNFPRPNGSAEGLVALRTSTGLLSPLTPPQQEVGCIDIARSSLPPSPSAIVPNGALAWMYFAVDGVAGATGPMICTGTPNPCASYTYTYTNGTTQSVIATPVPTAIIQADMFTLNDLVNLYKNCLPITEGGITYDPNSSIDLYLPPPGTDTRHFWATTLGFNESNPPTCVHTTIVGGALATATPAVPVADSDGTAVATDPKGYEPFTISQWISQRQHPSLDQRHAALLRNFTPCTGTTCTSPVAPIAGSPATGFQNAAFPINHIVYNVAPYTRVTNPADLLDSVLNASSASNFLCSEQVAILTYGFALNQALCGTIVARTN